MAGEASVRRIVAGPFMTNTYLVSSGGEAILIDPGDGKQYIMDRLPLGDARLSAVVSTHGHFDHVMGIREIKEETGCRSYLGQGDQDILEWSYTVSAKYMGKPLGRFDTDRYLGEGDTVRVGDSGLSVISLPGHTPGSIGLVMGKMFFTGDTLFRGSIGRTDIGGSMEQMKKTLKRISSMDPDLSIHPGHGPESTLGEELESNMFLGEFMEED